MEHKFKEGDRVKAKLEPHAVGVMANGGSSIVIGFTPYGNVFVEGTTGNWHPDNLILVPSRKRIVIIYGKT